jgi:hypothetical protein
MTKANGRPSAAASARATENPAPLRLAEESLQAVDRLPVWAFLTFDQKRFLNYLPLFKSERETSRAIGLPERWSEEQKRQSLGFSKAVDIRELQPAKHLPLWLEEVEMRNYLELESKAIDPESSTKDKMDAIKEMNKMRPPKVLAIPDRGHGARSRLGRRGMEGAPASESATEMEMTFGNEH